MNINENAASSASQCAQIYNFLMQGHHLTSLDALNLFGCMRLASRIHDLRDKGIDIQTKKVRVPSGKIVTQYSIAKA